MQQQARAVVGQRITYHSNGQRTAIEILCPFDAPESEPAGSRMTPIFRKEAHKKGLFCACCLKSLMTNEPVSTLTALIAQQIGAAPQASDRHLWERTWSWVFAEGLKTWMSQAAVPADLWRYTRLLLLEQLQQGAQIPERVLLEVEIRHGKALGATTIRYLDISGSFTNLLELMHQESCDQWLPLRERSYPPQSLSPREQRTHGAGILHDTSRSAQFAQYLKHTYGPFTLEWLFAAEKLF
jgi:hypothetical protein